MNNPTLSVRIKKNSLRDVFSFLQGISRYIDAIYIDRSIIEKEGLNVINQLISRYPKKKIIFEIKFDHKNFFVFLDVLLKKTNLLFYAIFFPHEQNLTSKDIERINKLFSKTSIKPTFFVNQNNYDQFCDLHLEHLGYYKNLDDLEDNEWGMKDFNALEKINKSKKTLKIFNINNKSLVKLKVNNINVNEIITGSDVTFSFNPIESCKKIYLTMKEIFI